MENQITFNEKDTGTSTEFSFKKVLNGKYNDVYAHVVAAFSKKGFGVVSEISMHEKFKVKLDVHIRPYKIIGVCNPEFAYQAMQNEENIGIFLPCKVLLKEIDEKSVEVVVLNPNSVMQLLNNAKLNQLAEEVTRILISVTNEL